MKKIMPFIFSIAMAYNVSASKDITSKDISRDITKRAIDFVTNNYSIIYPQGNNVIYIIDEIDADDHRYALEYICKDNNIYSGLKFEMRVLDMEKNTQEIFKNYSADEFDISNRDRYILKRNDKTINTKRKFKKEVLEKKYIKNLQTVLEHLENMIK